MSDESTRVMSDTEVDAAEQLVKKRMAEARTRPVDADLEARVAHYLSRSYRMEVRGDPEEGYLATAPELPGCMTAGETPDEALRMLRDAMATWLEAAIEAGASIPEPDEARYSGRLLLRMPKSLHARLAEQAARENVSLNQLAATLLAIGLGRGREGLLAELERALGIAGLPAGADRDLRRLVVEMVRALLANEQWDPAMDAPGSESTRVINAYMRLLGSIPPETFDEIQRRFQLFSAAHERASERLS